MENHVHGETQDLSTSGNCGRALVDFAAGVTFRGRGSQCNGARRARSSRLGPLTARLPAKMSAPEPAVSEETGGVPEDAFDDAAAAETEAPLGELPAAAEASVEASAAASASVDAAPADRNSGSAVSDAAEQDEAGPAQADWLSSSEGRCYMAPCVAAPLLHRPATRRGLCSRASQLCYSHGAHTQFKRDRLRNTPVGGRRGRSRCRASAGGPAAYHALLPGPPRPSAAGFSVPAGSAVPSCILQPVARASAQQRAPPAVPGRAAARGGRRAAVRAVRERLCGAGLRGAGAC